MVRKKNVFGDLQDFAVASASFGVSSAVGAGVGSRAPPSIPSVTSGFSAAAGFFPAMGVAVGGKTVLELLPKMSL